MKKLPHHFLFAFLMLYLASNQVLFAQAKRENKENLPVATQWLFDAAGDSGRSAINAVYMLECPRPTSKGTGFLLQGGYIITAAHVVKDCQVSDLVGVASSGEKISFNKMSIDLKRDLAILIPSKKIDGGLLLGSDNDPPVGTVVSTWGFPLAYNGPAPLLSVGYLSGFIAQQTDQTGTSFVKHLVVNSAFNPGNSGGPLFRASDNRVIGVVVSKHAPLTQFHQNALKALANQQSGFVYNATDENGIQIQFSEAQLVASLLIFYRQLSQVMIGEAVSVSELRVFLSEQGIKQPNNATK